MVGIFAVFKEWTNLLKISVIFEKKKTVNKCNTDNSSWLEKQKSDITIWFGEL